MTRPMPQRSGGRQAPPRGLRLLQAALALAVVVASLPPMAEAPRGILPPIQPVVETSSAAVQAPQGPPPVRFGFPVRHLDDAKGAEGIPLHYGSAWALADAIPGGFSGIRQALREADAHDVTPLIHWYYWGADARASCVANGCNGKSVAQWEGAARTLARVIGEERGGREAIVVLETEFNAQDLDNDAAFAPTFDHLLKRQVALFHQQPGVRTIIGFGDWETHLWSRFSGAVADSDHLGTMLLRCSLRHPGYARSAEDTLATARRLREVFGRDPATDKPDTFVYDWGLSSYGDGWGGGFDEEQDREHRELFDLLPRLQEANVRAIVFREWKDETERERPGWPSDNCGRAELHWGVKRSDGAEKPAFHTVRTRIAAQDEPLLGPKPPAQEPTEAAPWRADFARVSAPSALRTPSGRRGLSFSPRRSPMPSGSRPATGRGPLPSAGDRRRRWTRSSGTRPRARRASAR